MKLLSTTEEGYILQLTPVEMRNIDLAPLCLGCDENGIVEVNKIEFDSGGIGVVPKHHLVIDDPFSQSKPALKQIEKWINVLKRDKQINKYNKELFKLNGD